METEGLKTETTPLFIDLNQSILRKWDIATGIVAKQRYYTLLGSNAFHEEVVRAVYDLFLSIRNAWRNDLKKEKGKFTEYEAVFFEQTKPFNCTKCLELFDDLDEWLYNKGLTKFDTKIKYRRNIVEEANNFRGH